jgi:hypothetical protein
LKERLDIPMGALLREVLGLGMGRQQGASFDDSEMKQQEACFKPCFDVR